MAGLSPEQLESFHRDGFLVVKGALDEETMEAMRNRIEEIIMSWDGSSASVFTTGEGQATRDDYFLTSGDRVCPFWEEDAAPKPGEGLPEGRDRILAVNKVGHALHRVDDVFRRVSFSDSVASICKSLGFERPVAPQSMFIMKNPRVGGKVTPHQDSTFLYTSPISVTGFWWALHDATVENGCLWAVPGSHKTNPLKKRFVRREDGMGTEFIPVKDEDDGEGGEGGGEGGRESGEGGEGKRDVESSSSTSPTSSSPTSSSPYDGIESEYDLRGGVPLPVDAGDMVLIHSKVVHWSAPNTSPKPRYAYALHVTESAPPTVYPTSNWLLREDGSTDFLPVFPEHRADTGEGDRGSGEAKEE